MSDEITKIDKANAIVKRYMGWSAGGAAIPFPVWDLAAVTGSQIKMISDIAKLYDVPFSANVGRSAVSALLGTLAPAAATPFAISMVKFIPIVGPAIAFATGPSFAAAATYAIGKVFIKHFEAGGTLLDFDAESMTKYFEAKMAEGSKRSTSSKTAA